MSQRHIYNYVYYKRFIKTAVINWPQRAFHQHLTRRKYERSCDTKSKMVEETKEQMQAFLQQFNKDSFIQYNKHKTFLFPLESIRLRTQFLSVILELLKLNGQRKAVKVYCQNILFGRTLFTVSLDYVQINQPSSGI